jgi:hypothetical protein
MLPEREENINSSKQSTATTLVVKVSNIIRLGGLLVL